MTKYYCKKCKQFWKDRISKESKEQFEAFDHWAYCTSWGVEKKLCPSCKKKEILKSSKVNKSGI